ncbi:phosphoethanolamine--lipid A transferase [Shinella sumterensis]|uniref:Phosphatidylethanolamine:Kdo2-lipid A phosphoethanolamine transferase n=1 Tax=Rhizobium subbaraonis TaxID=908946 RepID=A0A285USJ0_9HYPH|nr:phosphoethanolamine--lipid A transferase [Rhizobium subbaraonis]WLS08774.1 phosphoethanolamine--lipid A transferase [Shinella sumterensis]SOC44814.1 phosphatidylethanolamine:Kdo2-lipid A phosphoethanolamine transferase [Rhizobium subbaraonis]
MKKVSATGSGKFLKKLEAFRPTLGSLPVSILAATYLLLFLNATFWARAGVYLQGEPWAYAGLFAAMFALFTIATVAVSVKYVIKPILIFYIAVAAAAAWFTDNYGVFVDTDMVRNVFETTRAESQDLMTPGLLRHFALYFVLPSALLSWVRVTHQTLGRKVLENGFTIFVCLLIFAGLAATFYKPYSAIVRTKRDLVKTLNPITPLVNTTKYLLGVSQEVALVVKPLGEDARIAAPSDGSSKPRVAIVIVGETARGASFSLDSYTRQTNPELARQNVIYYPNVSSCGTATDVSLPCMFSNLKRSGYSHKAGLENENVLDVLSRAGVDVTWMENNTGSKGVADRVRNVVITGSKDPRFCKDGDCWDEIFLEKIDEWLSGITKDSVLVLHQLGNHGPAYYERYPDAFRKFVPDCQTAELAQCTDAEIVNSYDNAILYTDFVLSGIVERLKARSSTLSTGFLYISDHGESLGENGLYLHGTPYFMAPDEQTRIPMITWFDGQFASSMGLGLDCLRKSAARPLSHDNLFSSLLGMMNVTAKVYQPEQDMFAVCRAAPALPSSS